MQDQGQSPHAVSSPVRRHTLGPSPLSMKGRHAHSNSLGSGSMGSNKSLNVQRQGYSQVQQFLFLSLSLFLSCSCSIPFSLLPEAASSNSLKRNVLRAICSSLFSMLLHSSITASWLIQGTILHQEDQPACLQRAAYMLLKGSLHAFRGQPVLAACMLSGSSQNQQLLPVSL